MRKPTFDRAGIIDTAFKLVVRDGMGALTARGLAAALGSSTIPVYMHFKGMEPLRDAVRRRAYDLLEEYLAKGSGGDLSLDIGIGFARYAFDYPNLCRALFIDSDCDKEQLKEFDDRLAARIWKSSTFTGLSESSMTELYKAFIIIIQGYVSLICAGYITDSSERSIRRRL